MQINNPDYINIYALALILFILGYAKIFNDNIENNALIYFSFITFIWGTTSFIRFSKKKTDTNKDFIKINVSDNIKCLFGERLCQEGNINLWTFLHFIIYLIAGILFPNRYLFFFIISILCEFFELYFTSYAAKFIIDPVFNMSGYVIGNVIRKI